MEHIIVRMVLQDSEEVLSPSCQRMSVPLPGRSLPWYLDSSWALEQVEGQISVTHALFNTVPFVFKGLPPMIF